MGWSHSENLRDEGGSGSQQAGRGVLSVMGADGDVVEMSRVQMKLQCPG